MTTHPAYRLEAIRGRDRPDGLRDFLLAHRGQDATIDLSGVRTLTGPQIELILIGARTWRAEGRTLMLTRAAPDLAHRMVGLGLPPALFAHGG